MKHFLRLLSAALLVVLSHSCFAQWTQLNTGTNDPIYCVRYQSNGEVWAGSYNGIFRSSNSGTTFNFVNGLNATLGNSQIIGSFDDIYVTGPASAIASGFFYLSNDLIIFGTANNGASWSHNFYTNSGNLPRYISAMDFDGAGNGVAVGGAGRVYKTANNGGTWTAGASGTTTTLEDVSWVNGTTYVSVSGSNIYRSVNGGQSWTSVLNFQSNIENVSFAHGTNTGYAGGYGVLKKSTDGGLTWAVLNIPAVDIRCIYAFSPDTLYIGAYDGVYRSISGGLYWEKFNIPNVQRVNDINFYDANNGMVAGDSGYVAVTSNGGGLPTPISLFSLPVGNNCQGTNIQPLNLGNPAWSYQWILNGNPVSTQHSPSLTLSTGGNNSLSLITSNNGYSDTSTTFFYVTSIPAILPFTVINDTICQGGQGHFYIPNSQVLVNYTLFDGNTQVGTTQGGTGNTVTLSTATNQSTIKTYRIRATSNNVCGADTLEVFDSLWIAAPAANVSAMLYRDTICTGDTTYMLIYNSEPGWDYYCSNNTFLKVDGTGGTIGIPLGPITSSVNITVTARFKSLNCLKTLPGTFTLTYRGTSASVSPGTLQGAIGQPVNMTATSTGFNAWDWSFGNGASPLTGSGQTPSAPSYAVAGIDTVTLTARLDYTCEKIIKKPVYIYGSLPVSTTITCAADTFSGTIGTSTYKYCFDEFNNLHAVGYNAQSTNFAFTPYVLRLDSNGTRRYYMTFNSTGNNPGAQGLINGITADRQTNTYFATHYVSPSRFDIQGNFIRNKNAIIKLNENGNFKWAIEAPLADFSDMITVNNRIFAVGINAWNGCEFQTPEGPYKYTPSISNKGEAFIMELNADGQILTFDAFGSGGSGGVTTPAKFKVKYPLMNQYFAYDTLRQNLIARKGNNGDILISGMLDASSIGSPVNFSNQVMTNNLPAGTAAEKCLFVSRYDLSTGFTDAVTLMSGQPEFITDYKETNSGNLVYLGRAKNKLITSQGTITFPVQNYEYQFVASFQPSGTLNWIMYADSMSFKSIGTNNDGSVSVLAFMSTKYLIVDGTNTPFNVSPVPTIGTFMLRFGASGELLSADRTSDFAAITSQQDACGNHHVFHSTNAGLQFRAFRSIVTSNGTCGNYCYAAYNATLKDAALDSVTLSDITTTGPATRNISIKVKSKSVVPVTSLEVKYHINNDAVQTLIWNGNILTGDSVTFAVNSYNFSKNYNRIRVWIEKVNGSTDDFQENDTIIQSQIICTTPLAGTYSAGCDTCYFDNIQASATTLKTCGVSDPVKIAIEPGYYTEQVKIEAIPSASANDTIVWTSRTGSADDVILELGSDYSYYRNPLYLFYTQFCSIDHLTIRNSVPRTYDAMQADPAGQSVVNMETVHDINLTNCKLYGIPRSSAVSGNGNTVQCYSCQNIRMLNNYIYQGEAGINMGGSLTSDRNIMIANNTLRQNNGMHFYNISKLDIDHNDMQSIGTEHTQRLSIQSCDSIRVSNNMVTSENWGDETLDLYCQCSTSNYCYLYNNIFSSSPFWLPVAGASINADNLDVVNNSFGHGVLLYTSNNLTFVNNLVRTNGTAAVEISSPSFFSTFNNNRYQSIGSPLNFINNGNDYTIATWKTATGFDSQSDSVTAEYTTLTDMHLRSAISMPGVTWPGITTDIDGEPRSMTTPTIGADEYSPNPALGFVWPGDCDSSKNVDNFDLLPIGLYYNHYSTSRPNDPSFAWIAQPSLLWNETQGSGINMNHADANGDGWINLSDTVVVIDNYGLTHALANPDPQRLMTGPDLAVIPVGTVFSAGDTVHLKVMAGNSGLPVDLLSAIGFKVTLPAGLIVPGSYNVTTINNWLCPDSNCIMFHQADEVTGIAAVSLARLDGDQVSAYGELADISFVVNAAYTGNPTVTIPLSDYRSFEPDATPINLSPVDGTIQVLNTSVEEQQAFDGISIFPNPASNVATILFNWKGRQGDELQLKISDVTGRTVKVLPTTQITTGANMIPADCSGLREGLYFIQLISGQEQSTIKFIKK
ncbi:MAG: T9SS type A sorting domain-containing protein [Bacteroidia bacterium]